MFKAKNLGISTNIFRNPQNIPSTVILLSAKFSIIEIELEGKAKTVLASDSYYYSETTDHLNVLKEQKKLTYNVHAPYRGKQYDLCATDPVIREIAISNIFSAIEFAHEIGSKKVTFHPGYIPDNHPDKTLDNLKFSIEILLKKSLNLGVSLCLENTGNERPNYVCLSTEQHIELCQSTGVFLTLDIVHSLSHHHLSPDFENELKKFIPHTKNMHLADMEEFKHMHLPLGSGFLPIENILKTIDSLGFQDSIIIEERGGGYSSEIFLEKALNFKNSLN